MKKRLYKWHRILSMLIALPLVLWAGSGFMHPLMTSIRPKIATQNLPVLAVDFSRIKVGLKETLDKNGISRIKNFRLVHIGGNWFYQVKIPGQNELLYFSTDKGKRLPKGDVLYARYLAGQFLGGVRKEQGTKSKELIANSQQLTATSDCCAAATETAMGITGSTRILAVKPVTGFTPEYKSVNRLLPVYKVFFNRDDDLRIYVETGHDRFALAVDNNRERFDRWFGWFHTWTWLDGFGHVQVIAMGLIMLVIFATSLIGLWLFFSTKSKKTDHVVVKARRWHRYTAVSISLFTLLFSLSGFLHIAAKWNPDELHKVFVADTFSTHKMNLSFSALKQHIPDSMQITNVGLVKMNTGDYWQVATKSRESGVLSSESKRPMAEMQAAMPETFYLSCADLKPLSGGEKMYAAYLAQRLLMQEEQSAHSQQPTATFPITRFGNEYNFADKRLPVWVVTFKNGEQYYVETSSGHLASKVSAADLLEGYSFALLHKHHFMDWGGKTVRDLSTLFWAGAQIFMVIFGLVLFYRIQTQKRKKTSV